MSERRDGWRIAGRHFLDYHQNSNDVTNTIDKRNIEYESDGYSLSSFKKRIKHFTWAWFTLTMSTGGIASLLAVTPNRFPHLTTIGTIIYILDLVLFVCLCSGMILRFYFFPEMFKRSFTHSTESLFFPAFWLSFATIIAGMQEYGNPPTTAGPWLNDALRVIFWIYVACTFLIACFQYFYLFSGQPLTVQSMTPAWILPILPLMLSGMIAGIIAPYQPVHHNTAIIVAGFTFQSLGFLVSILMFTNFIGRMMQSGLPAPNARGGMFLTVGPASFTALAYIAMAHALPQHYSYTEWYPTAYAIMRTMSLIAGIILWGLAFWFFSISLISVIAGMRKMSFHLTWYCFVFPNVGFTIATISIGRELRSDAILVVGSVMTVLLVLVWFFVMANHVMAVWRCQILYPGKDEDA